MQKIWAIVGVLVIGALILFNFQKTKTVSQPEQSASQIPGKAESPEPQIIASNLEIPWELIFLPDGRMLVTERPGRLLLIGNEKKTGTEKKNYDIKEVAHIGEGGLLGMALDPDFSKNNFLYLYFTYRSDGKTLNKVQRFVFKDETLTEDKVIIDGIAGSNNHDGGRINFGPDKALYITTGDAQNPSSAQDLNSLAGKILRYDGTKVEIFSYGHRNPQGLVWDQDGNLWATEHGPSGIWPNCCQDEINLIKKGSNYGWPDSKGDKIMAGTIGPIIHSGREVWAPSGAAIKDGKLYFAGLRGEAIYSLDLATKELKVLLKGRYGRIRSITIGPDGAFYLITSNRDGRGSPTAEDDRLIRITTLE